LYFPFSFCFGWGLFSTCMLLISWTSCKNSIWSFHIHILWTLHYNNP
jgi:hypothetical protein